MAEFDIGNGKVIEIPDDLSGADRDELAAIVQRQYGVDINKTTILGQAEATLKGIPRGAAKGLMGLVEAPARLFDIGNDSEFVQGLSQFKDYLDTESVLAADPEYRDTWMTQLGEGFGSTVPFLGAGKVGSLLAARGVGGRGLLDPRFLAGVPLAASMGQVEASENVDASRALGEDVSPLQEIIAELGGPIIGLSEMLPIFNLFKRVPKNALKYSDIRRKIQSAAAAFGEEGLQEVSASLAQDLLARGLYSDELPIGDSIFDEFTIGGSVGAIADLAVNAMSGRSRGREYLRDREKQARKNQVTLEVENKFERGQKQGTLEEVTDDIPIEEKPLVPIPAKIINPPILEVIQNTDNTFSVIDLNNKESEFGVGTILKTFDNESKAFVFKNKQETNHERKKLAVELKNITYNLGMPESASAHRLGATILDPNISSINLQTLINFDSKLSSEQKKIFNQQKNKVIGPNPYQEMLANKAKHLEAITKYMKQKGFNLQATYTMPQVKKILSKKDFDSFSKDLSNVIHSESVKNKEPSILVDKEKFNVNLKYIKDLAASKNIDIDFKDPAVRYAALQWTGVEDITKANRGTKELFLTRLHSLPKFNSKTKFPDFRPRKYTAKDMADFVASKGSENIEFSVKDLLKNGVTAKDKASTERFINDLIISGRAKKVEGKNKYKINKNFEYDIARRAEGFNETPEEFGDRLRQEGKLPEEAILKLIEDEKIKQRKVLPPQEIDKKVINYKEAVEEGRVNKFAKELNKILSKMGLTETGLVVSNDILSTTNLVENAEGKIVFDPRGTRATEEGVVEGEYDKNTDIIFLSLDAVNPDGTATDEEILSRLTRILDHESIHALREKDLINEKEYQYLREEVKRKKVPSTFDGQYKGKTFYQRAVIQNQGREDLDTVTVERKEELYVEEAIAEMYRSRNHSPDLSPKSTGILNKIARFFKSMGQAMRLSGFQKTSDIFAEIEQGKIGSRDRGEIRTLRELDRLSPSLIDMPIAEPTEGETPVNEPTDVVTIGESGGIATPVTTFEDVESDIDPITGVLISPSGFGRAGSSIFNFRKQTKEQLEAQRVAMIQEFGYGHVKSEDVLTWLSKNAPSKDYKVIADRLLTQVKKLRKMKKIDFQFRIIIEGTDRLPIPGHTGERLNWHGVSYAPFSYEGGIRQQVYIADRGRPRGKTRAKVDGVNLETVLHELVHQATQAATYDFNIDAKTKENLAELEKIRKRVREEINARKRAGENIDNYVQYGTKNVQELLAVGFTDREFQKFMESIPYSPRGKKSLWDKFTETLRKLLNIPAKQGTAFSEFLLQAGRITNLSQKQIAPLLGGREMSGRVNFGPPVADYEIRKRFTPEQQKILDRIERIDIELMQITSELKDSMGSNTYNRIMSKRDSLIAERSDLNEKLNTLPEPPINPNIESQIPLFSRTRTPTQSAADQYNITKLQKNALYTGKPIDVSAVRSRLNKYTDEQLFEIGADAQRTSIEGMFSNYDKAVGYLSTSMPIGDLYGASMGFGTNGNIMAIKPIARLAEKLRKPSVTDTYNHPPDIKIYQRKFSEMTAEQKAVASRYAEASRKLPTFNEVQWMARQFNIALGELNLPLLSRVSDYFEDASLPNNIKNVIDKSTKIDPYYIEIPDIEYFDNIVKELYKNSASGNFLPDKNVPMFSRSRNPNQERIDSLNQVLAGIQGQLRESTSPKTVTRLRARERKLKDEIEMLEGLQDDDAPLFSRTGRKHGVDRAYTIESEGEVTGKPSVVKVMTDNNADEVIENLQGLLDRHPSALDSEEAWLAFERDLVGDNETFIPPTGLINLVNNLDSWKNLHTNKLNKKQLQNVDLGFRAVEEMRKIYADGTATPETTAKLMAWGILSRGASAVNQESAFIDAANDPKLNEFIARALEKEFTDVDVKEYLEWSKTVMPEGSFGKSVTNNLNAFGELFLKKTSKKQANGISKLQAIHNLFANQDLSSVEIRREYYKIVQNSGINNKVLSFNLLMSGRNDVVVLDRIQINNMWDGKNKYQKNIYDDVSNQVNNIHGLARYEVMEKALLNKIDSLYEAIGRPQDSSVGRYHWESWVRSSNQEVEHPSVQGIYKEALEGMDSKPYADLGVPEGRYNFYNYGATYVRGADGNAYVNYPKSNGDMAKFSLEQYNEFINLVKKPSTGVVPKGFLVSKIKEGFPWYEIEGVNREKLDQIIESYAKRTTSTRKVLQDNGENIQSDVTRRRESPETRRRREQLKEITDEVAPQPTELDVPLFSRKNRDSSQGNTSEAIARRRAVESVVETVKRTPRGDIPHYNANASDVALEAAYNFNNDPTAPTPEMPKFSVGTVPDYLKETADRVGISQPKKTLFESIMDVIQNPVENIRYMFKNVRSNIVDGLSAVDKILLDGQDKEWYLSRGFTEQEAEEKSRAFRLADNNVLTRTIANLRLADKTRGLFQHMITQGNITDQVIDENSETGYSDSIAVVEDMELVDENNKLTGKFGGLMQFFAPLYQSNSGNDLVTIFGVYAKIKRPEQKNEITGEIKKSPVIEKDREQVSQIEKDFPEVVAAYNNYQKWNNKIIEFAVKKGILNKEQADEWIAHSSYYPYYRDMAMTEEALKNSKITAPTISGGALPSNPLDIELKGSEKPITVDPIEAISRNSLSIITAALKNNGAVMLMKDLESMGLAESMGRSVKKFDKKGNRISTFNIVHAYENGEKFFYNLEDAEIHNALSAVGGTSTSTLAKWVGIPSTLLRDTVTRDPGFIVVNILRDTLSSAVTSGAAYGNSEDGYLPVIDSFKNMFGEMGELEKFGIIGGYDFSNDEGSVKQFVERTMRRQGLTKNGAMKPQDAFYKIWDGLGALTTKSDGATRKAVYDSVYKHMIKKGVTEGQAQSEAAYQALEVINFGRRGLSTNFKVVTAAIPFLNARIQGLDVLYRSFSGKYSAIDKLQGDETRQELKGRILRGAILRGATLSLITGLYYMMVSDTDEYKGARREVRDDYWIIPTGTDFPIRIPIPFEVGAIFKVLPERLIDMAMGDDAFTKKAVGEAKTSLGRQLGTSLGLPFTQPGFGIQAVKPLFEVWNNRNSFTDSEIIPYYQTKLDPRAQSTERTNELARVLGEAFNVSPTKIDYVMRGYAGTLGGYLLSMADTGTRMITGTPILPNNVELSRLPLIRRLTFDSKKAGGLQQQFYELRGEVDKVVQTVNKLNNDGRADEAIAYRSNMQGVLDVKGQVRLMERYLANWRKRRRRLLQRDDISITVRSDMLRDMEMERDRRLAMIPELRKQANIPIASFGL